MSKEGMVVLLGALVLILPFSGIPSAWLSFVYPILGLAITALALMLLRLRRDARARRESAAPAYEPR
ncbi:MAG: hypothetical protein KBC38_01620 [Candidatus Pacebacteria bacterium]|nr:hypothetical protein [Candidatus Paceibacterota bacterium]MBP9840741.1 hypothetical protein [Candidatus Paceibacterota bacterium]